MAVTHNETMFFPKFPRHKIPLPTRLLLRPTLTSDFSRLEMSALIHIDVEQLEVFFPKICSIHVTYSFQN